MHEKGSNLHIFAVNFLANAITFSHLYMLKVFRCSVKFINQIYLLYSINIEYLNFKLEVFLQLLCLVFLLSFIRRLSCRCRHLCYRLRILQISIFSSRIFHAPDVVVTVTAVTFTQFSIFVSNHATIVHGCFPIIKIQHKNFI